MKYYMGIDPSTVSTGYAIISETGELVAYGTITPEEEEMHHKIQYQYDVLREVVAKYNIAGICSEEQFSGLNADTLKKLCQVTGIIMLFASQLNVQYTMKYPASWRKDFHGNGAVKKEDTLKLVNEKYGLNLRKKDNDIADAIGMAHVAYQIGQQ